MLLRRNFNFRWCATLGIVLLLAHETIGISRIAYAGEDEQRALEDIDEIVSGTVGQESSEIIEEIVVHSDKPLHALRRDVYRAEERFFDLFSALNQDDDFDVRCFYEIPSFTHIRRHICRANFVVDATSNEAARLLGKASGPALPAELVNQRKSEQMREIMEALIVEHPELLQALGAYTNARQILEAEKEQRID